MTRFKHFRPGWRTSTVLAMGKAVVETGNPDALPVLADALEEAGCDDKQLLAFCRAPERWLNAAGVAAWLSGALPDADEADDAEAEEDEEMRDDAG